MGIAKTFFKNKTKQKKNYEEQQILHWQWSRFEWPKMI